MIAGAGKAHEELRQMLVIADLVPGLAFKIHELAGDVLVGCHGSQAMSGVNRSRM
jgi:hypothetical protein